MESRVILDRYKHQPGGSCIASALSNVLKYKGYNYSQDFIISSGLNFGFISDLRKNIWNVEFISSKMLPHILGSNIGIFIEELQLTNNKRALDIVLSKLNEGIPVIVKLDPQYCKGLKKVISEDLIPYLPSHNVVVYGYDLSENKIYLYDSPCFNSIEIEIDDFCKGRSLGKTCPMNTYYEFHFPLNNFPIDISIKLTIQGLINRYRYSGRYLNFRTGFIALDRFLGSIQNWKRELNDDEIIDRCRSLKMSITNGQAVKGAFRYHFARFLGEASNVLNIDLKHVIEVYIYLGFLWTQIEEILDKIIRSTNKHLCLENDALLFYYLEEIVYKEKEGLILLEEVVKLKNVL